MIERVQDSVVDFFGESWPSSGQSSPVNEGSSVFGVGVALGKSYAE
jgi:hypothetical protein